MQVKLKRLFCLVLATTYSARGTTIIAVIYRDAIYLASDSKITYAGSPPKDVPRAVCKIFHNKTRAFACSGPSNDRTVGFDLDKTILNLMSSQKTLTQWITESDEATRVGTRRVLDHLKRDFPAYYASRLGFILVDCAFASWESNEPTLIDDIWLLRADGTLQHEAWSRISSTGEKNSIVIGSRDAIEKRYKDGTAFGAARPTVPEMLQGLIGIQIEAAERSPDPFLGPTVGPPVSILRIDHRGSHWENPGVCESQ
jgi:hypothetical protein